jgi:glycosyltransferase involved in cell wall biosynthesis
MLAEGTAERPRIRRQGRFALARRNLAALFSSYLAGKYYLFGFRVRLRAAFTRYDFCHAMEAMSLFATRGFAARGVPVVLDVNEIPDPFERQGAQFIAAGAPVKHHLARAFARDLPASRAIIATSDAMADFVAERFGRAAVAIPNARAPVATGSSVAIRGDVGAAPDTRILVYPCTAAPHLGVEASIELVRRLPEEFRLVFVGRFVTPAYRETIERQIRRHGLQHRVLLKDELPDEAYLRYLAGADIGLVPLSFAYRNQRLVLPWRVIDLALARVPIVASPSEAVCRLARDADIGEIAASAEVEDLLAAVRRLASSSPERIVAIKHALGAMADAFSPDRLEARYRAVLDALARRGAGRAAFVANLALRRNRRFIAFIDQACALRWRVDLYCVRAPDRNLFRRPDRIRFIEVSDCLVPRWLRAAWRVIGREYLSAPGVRMVFAGWWSGFRQLRRAARFAGAVRAETRRRGPWDIVIATDVFALAAGLAARGPDSLLVYDATEIPDLRQRTAPALRAIPAPLRLLFRRWERAYVRDAGLILATSHALARYLRRRYRRRTAAPVLAVRNAASDSRDALPAATAPGLRDRLGVPAGDIVLVSPCGISVETGGLVAARMLRFLPADHVLVFIGRFSNARAEMAIRDTLRRDRTGHRCFFLGEVDYATYLRWLGECDIGLVLFDPAIANMNLAAPNRFFDLMAAGVPTVATELAEVAAMLRRQRTGSVVRERRPAAVARAVMELRQRFGIAGGGIIDPRARARLDRVARHHHADQEQARLGAALARQAGGLTGKRVALLTLRSAFSNRRFRRVAANLEAAGASVTAFDTDIGWTAPAADRPRWLTTIALR